MKIVGLITEYNPFHNGHFYHLKRAKELTNADYVVVIMSGNFLQRGVPAFIEKQDRTKMALANGADLVLELPACYATGSAEYFAFGAISTLDRLRVISDVCFGSECGDVTILEEIADVLIEEPAPYQKRLKELLKKGASYPTAREAALLAYLEEKKDITYDVLLSNPNNILGIEYIKAIKKLKSNLKPVTLQRIGAGYHELATNHTICSASGIRNELLTTKNPECLKHQVPPSVYETLQTQYQVNFPIELNDFSTMLKYRLLLPNQEPFSAFLDVSEDLADRIKNNLANFTSYESFASLLKNKQYTLTRIQRALLHLLLNITKEKMSLYIKEGISYYARILGFKKSSAELLRAIKHNSSIPLISKLADAGNILTPIGLSMLEQDIFASDLYHSIVTEKFQTPLMNEYTKSIVLFP